MAVVIKKEMINQMNEDKELRYIVIADVDGVVMEFSSGMTASTSGPDAEIARARSACVDAATAAGLA